jgi:hypothetical protein
VEKRRRSGVGTDVAHFSPVRSAFGLFFRSAPVSSVEGWLRLNGPARRHGCKSNLAQQRLILLHFNRVKVKRLVGL